MNLTGKSREQIGQATKNLSRGQLLDLMFELVTVEAMLTPTELAARCRMSKKMILQKIHNGEIRGHKTLKNGIRVKLSDARAWIDNCALFVKSELQPGKIADGQK